MARWIWLPVFVIVLWAGAFGISFFVAEWRGRDLDETQKDISGLRADVEAIRGRVGVSAEREETPTPGAEVALLKPGTEVTSGNARITVVGVTGTAGAEAGPFRSRVDFILEGPHSGAIGQNFKVVDKEGFVCEAGINAQTGTPLGTGEKDRFWIAYKCAEGSGPKTLFLDAIRFEFPQP